MMDLKATEMTIDDGVGVITLCRPARMNAWTGRMHTEYRSCLAELDNEPGVGVSVVTGKGRGFFPPRGVNARPNSFTTDSHSIIRRMLRKFDRQYFRILLRQKPPSGFRNCNIACQMFSRLRKSESGFSNFKCALSA